MRKLALAFFLLPAIAAADIQYTLTPLPGSRAISVTVSNDDPRATEVFRIPAWCPGFYFIQNYQDKIFDVVATNSEGRTLPVQRPDKRAWSVANPNLDVVTLTYKVQGDDAGLGFFGVNVLDDKAFVNGPAGFMYAEGLLTEPVQLTIQSPEGWDVATGMTRRPDGKWVADGYDELADHPIQLGKMERKTFKVGEYDFEAVFASADNVIRPNLDAQVQMLQKVSSQVIKTYGSAPFKRYVYLIHLTNQGFLGGLEHRASTLIAMPNTSNLDMTTLAAHEFIHTWNVKNIRPKVLGPFDYTQEVRTGNLWFAEGVTDYYANVEVYRTGLRDAAWLYRTLGNEIQTLQNSKSRLAISLEEASRQTWGNGGFGFGDMSYYNKGLVAGLILDSAIRGASNGQKSLDDVMRLMYERYYLPEPGYDEDDIRLTINEIVEPDLSIIYRKTIRSKEEVPYDVLKQIGLIALSPGVQHPDGGFTSVANTVTQVSEAAQAAGLKVGDVILGADDSTPSTLRLKIWRGEASQDISIPVGIRTVNRWTLVENPFATTQERKNLTGFLKR